MKLLILSIFILFIGCTQNPLIKSEEIQFKTETWHLDVYRNGFCKLDIREKSYTGDWSGSFNEGDTLTTTFEVPMINNTYILKRRFISRNKHLVSIDTNPELNVYLKQKEVQ